jgi:hypothetical protein
MRGYATDEIIDFIRYNKIAFPRFGKKRKTDLKESL